MTPRAASLGDGFCASVRWSRLRTDDLPEAWRRRLAAGVALAAVLVVGLVYQGRLADWSAPPANPGDGDEVPWVDPSSLRVAAAGGCRPGRYDRLNPDDKRELVGNLVMAAQGQPKASAMGTFEEPVQAELLDERPGLPARFWVAVLLAGGITAQTVHQVRSYDPDGRELCRLDPDTLPPRCTG